MAKLIPYIYGENVREQAAFYAKSLGGEIVSVQTFGDGPHSSPETKDKVMHLVLQAAGLTFFMADGSGPLERGGGLDLSLIYENEEEARTAFLALAEGGKVLMPFERMFWGTMFGRLVDRFGVRWQVATES